jgi:hypothetical protein
MAIARKFGDKIYKWHVPDLHAAAKGLPVKEVPTRQFNLDVDAWFGEACPPTIKNVIDHIKRIQNADLREPILLSAEGYVFDGLHRLARCALEGIPKITCQQFETNPEPFEILDFAAFAQDRPLIAATLVWMEQNTL